MPDQALNCKRLYQQLVSICWIGFAMSGLFATQLISTSATAADPYAGTNSPQVGGASQTLLLMPVPRPRWGFDLAFYQNGARSGALIQGNAPEFGPDWMPQFGVGLQSIDIEGHPIDSTGSSSEVHSAEFAFVSIKFQNPYLRGMVRTFAVARIGTLLTSDVAHSKATGAGYLGFGGEFPYAEMANALFAANSSNRSVSFYLEAGVPLTSDSTQATSIQGSPYIFNGVATTVGFKYAL